MKKEYISVSELAKMLGMSRTAVHKKIKKGQIEAIMIGNSYAIPREFVEKNIVDIQGTKLSEKQKARIDKAVKKVVKEYGDVLKKLGNE